MASLCEASGISYRDVKQLLRRATARLGRRPGNGYGKPPNFTAILLRNFAS
jgi:hypothetical protein